MSRVSRGRYITGERGTNRVRVFADPRTGKYYLEYREQAQRRAVALGHRDFARAKAEADELAAQLRRGLPEPDQFTLATLFDNYLREVTPGKSPAKQAHDRRTLAFALEVWGPARRAVELTHRDAARYVAERRRRGDRRPGECRGRPLRPRSIVYDLGLLRAVFTWAVNAGWLARNPLAGFRAEPDPSPRRPVLSAAEYEALLAVANRVDPVFRTALILAHETGHRRGAIRMLRWEDVDLERAMVRWRGEHDKGRFEHETTLTEAAVAALVEARRRLVMSPWVLPSPRNPARPVSPHLLRDWWERAERLAGLPHEPWRGWHSLRRKFASELRDAPLKALCALGGWKRPETVLMCYQHVDEVAMREALAARRRLGA